MDDFPTRRRRGRARLVAARAARLGRFPQKARRAGDAVRRGRFRADLYYRLNVVSIELPPLRDRGDDVGLLAIHFASGASRALSRDPPRVSAEVLDRLGAHSWPGNLRELRNVMERAVLFSSGDTIEVGHLPEALRARPALPLPYRAARAAALLDFRAAYLKHLLAAHAGNLSQAARAAGMARQTLHRLLRELREAGGGTIL